MKMAKATEEDMAAVLRLAGILDDVNDGKYPRGVDGEVQEGDPEYFDEDNPVHLRVFFDRVMHCMNESPGNLSRVIYGMHTVMHNNILDPDVDHLALHPRFKDVSVELEEERLG